MTEMTDARGIRTLAHHDLGGYGDAMQQMPYGDALYVGHFGVTGMGTSVLDVGDRRNPRLVRQWPAPQGSHTHKVQAADGLLLVNQEQFRGGEPHAAGMAVYSLEDPLAPRQIGFFESGGRGVHRIVWRGGRYAYVSATPDGFDDRIWVIVDLSDPEHPVEAGRWWWPGMWRDGDETPDWSGDRRYALSVATHPRDDRTIVEADDQLEVATEDAHQMVLRLAREEGILVGVSSGGNLVAAMQVAEKLKEGVVVTIFCDSAAKYLSEDFWQETVPPSFNI
jgi:hypothetical protein